MSSGYIPQKIADYAIWLANFDAHVTSQGSVYGVGSGNVTAMAGLAAAFVGAYAISSVPGTRTPVSVQDTAVARAAATLKAQEIAMILQANPLMDNGVRAVFGITVLSGVRTPIPTPTAVPDLSIQSITSGMVVLRAKTLGSFGNAKPFGAANCRIYRKTGTVAPTSIADCTFLGSMSKRFFSDNVSALAPGLQLWYIAVFSTTTGKYGPESSTITCNVSA